MDPDHWVKKFEVVRPKYEALTRELKYLLNRLLDSNGVTAVLVEARTKGIEEFRGKITRPDKSYLDPLAEISDLSGARIILRDLETVDRVCNLISEQFDVDLKRSLRRTDWHGVDQFGYLSDHLVVKTHESRRQLPEWAGLSDLWGEIQVRTALQHAWASVSRDLDYNNAFDMPRELRRRLFRLSALFELADEEFDALQKSRQRILDEYSIEIKQDRQDIAINVDSLKTYIEESESVKYWAEFIQSLGVNINPPGSISRDVRMAHRAGLRTLKEVDDLLSQSKGWGEQFLEEYYRNTYAEPIRSKRLSVDLNGVVTTFLIANFPDTFLDEVLEKEFGWARGFAKNVTVPAKKWKPKRETS